MRFRRWCSLFLALLAASSASFGLSAQGSSSGNAVRGLPTQPDGLYFKTATLPPQTPELPPQARPARGRGALWGAGIGVLAGGILGGLSVGSDDESDEFGEPLLEAAATGEAVLLGALMGGIVGGLLGATVFAPSRSSTAQRAAPGLSIDPLLSTDRAGAVVRIRW